MTAVRQRRSERSRSSFAVQARFEAAAPRHGALELEYVELGLRVVMSSGHVATTLGGPRGPAFHHDVELLEELAAQHEPRQSLRKAPSPLR